ncbi:4642_t:CDS:2 [Paraglomus occultum]|uniref:4642_t:CDS:1 n=1 Tax=Paraglomus occultum TaxID=144539 RepID=A0A9N9FNL4_9GLOM|nr:4642_t:CDS:2 [Paraglomus occultum]
MKCQPIIVFLIIGFVFGSYTQACTFFAEGRYKHQTGDESGGCFGFDKTDAIKKIRVSNPGTRYKLFANTGCKGIVVATGHDTTRFNPAIKFGSVKLTCPEQCIPATVTTALPVSTTSMFPDCTFTATSTVNCPGNSGHTVRNNNCPTVTCTLAETTCLFIPPP